jgi:CheY-like chemotaxis protein
MMPQLGRILVADDEATFREAIVALLRRAGYECDGVGSSAAAIAHLAASPCDLLISDIRMPGNAGLELIRLLSESFPELPVILITGYPSVETAAPAFGFRVVGYLIKPVPTEELISLVKRTLQQRLACRAVEENLKRMTDWSHDLQGLLASLRPMQVEPFNQTLGTFLNLTLRGIIGSLHDVRGVMQIMVEGKPTPASVQALESSRPLLLLAALQDAIRVIERTKSTFKSKELAEVRERLETLLRDPAPSLPLNIER